MEIILPIPAIIVPDRIVWGRCYDGDGITYYRMDKLNFEGVEMDSVIAV